MIVCILVRNNKTENERKVQYKKRSESKIIAESLVVFMHWKRHFLGAFAVSNVIQKSKNQGGTVL